MDLPAHVLYTYALEKIAMPILVDNNPQFVFTSLVFSALPDLLESTPFLIYLAFNRSKFGLKNLRSIVAFAIDISHNRPSQYEIEFPWAVQVSFLTHSFLLYAVFSFLFYLFFYPLFLPFLIGYGFHLFVDIFMHDDYFSSRPLYPISNFSIHGIFTWYKVRNFSIYNYVLLFFVYLTLYQ
jgi:hypothetical protein